MIPPTITTLPTTGRKPSGPAPRRYQPPPLRGFTLIELLVAVTIIAILAAILLPTIGAARTRADSVVAMSTLRQLGAVLARVAAENNNTLPVGFGGNNTNRDYTRRLTSGEFGSSLTIPAWKDLFVNKLATTKEKYEPSDGRFGFVDTTPYGMNFNLNDLCDNIGTSATWSTLRLNKPAGTVVLGDGRISGKSAGSRIKYLAEPGQSESISYRHPGNKASFLFADWHVELATRAEALANPGWFDTTLQDRP